MTLGEAEDRILDTLRGEYDRTGEVDWWAARDLCLVAAVPEELFGPAIEVMIRRRLADARIDPKRGRCLRLGRIGVLHGGHADDQAVVEARGAVWAPSTRGGRPRGRTSRIAECLAALIRPLKGWVP